MKTLLITLTILFGLNTKIFISQIISSPINQTIIVSSGPLNIDINNDGTDDYIFEILPLAGTSKAARVISIGNSSVMDGSTFGYPDALNLGDNVSGPYSSGNAVLGTDVGGGGQFSGAGLKYLGLNIDIWGQSHLGWISLEVSMNNDTIFLNDSGFNTTANNAINAGQTSFSYLNEKIPIDFEIFPNPCTNTLSINWINLNEETSFYITDVTCKSTLNGVLTNNIDLSLLHPGAYMLTLVNGNKIGRKKFIKTN